MRASLLTEIVGTTPPTDRPWAVAVEPSIARGVVPGWGLGAAARLERALTPGLVLRAGMMGIYGPDGSFKGTSGRFDVLLLAATLDVCGVLALSKRVDGRACQGFSAGGLNAQGRAFPESNHALVRWFAVANSLDLTVRLSDDWAFQLGVALLVPLERTTIVVRNSSQAVVDQQDLAAAGVVAQVGPMYRF